MQINITKLLVSRCTIGTTVSQHFRGSLFSIAFSYFTTSFTKLCLHDITLGSCIASLVRSRILCKVSADGSNMVEILKLIHNKQPKRITRHALSTWTVLPPFIPRCVPFISFGYPHPPQLLSLIQLSFLTRRLLLHNNRSWASCIFSHLHTTKIIVFLIGLGAGVSFFEGSNCPYHQPTPKYLNSRILWYSEGIPSRFKSNLIVVDKSSRKEILRTNWTDIVLKTKLSSSYICRIKHEG